MRRQTELGRARAVGWLARSLGLCWLWLGTVHAAPPVEQPDNAEQQPPPDAEPTTPTTAREWYDHGIELGNDGDFVGAAEAFLRSYELQPTSEALYNAGFAYRQAGEAIAAIEQYRRFLIEPDRDEQLARAAEQAIDDLLQQVGTLENVRYSPSRPPAKLYVAGERRELDELPILLQPGPVDIEVVDQQGVRARDTYEVAAGEALEIDLDELLPPLPPELPDVDNVEIAPGPSAEQLAAARARKRRARQLRITTWVGLGLTGAAGVSVATFGGLAARERNAYLDATCLETGVCPEGFVPGDPEAHLAAYERHRLGAVISAGLVGGLALGTLVVGLVSLRAERKANREAARVRVIPHIGGVALQF